MKIFVPGGAGYIGSVFVGQALLDGHQVSVADSLLYGGQGLVSLAGHPGFSFTRADFRDTTEMFRMAKGADVIIPLAAIVGAPAVDRHPKQAAQINLDAPVRFLKKISSQQILIMPTTNSAYGHTSENEVCDENSPLTPLSDYARAKVIVEQELMQNANAISFRLATAFGLSPRMRLDLLVNDFCARAIAGEVLDLFEGHFRRNFVHVRDVSSVFRFGIENIEKLRGQIFNVGLSSANLTKLQLAQKIQTHLPDFKVRLVESGRDPDQRNYVVSNAKIEAVGFRAKYSLDDGIKELIRAGGLLDRNLMHNLWPRFSEFKPLEHGLPKCEDGLVAQGAR